METATKSGHIAKNVKRSSLDSSKYIKKILVALSNKDETDMKHNTEFKVSFTNDTEYKSLYPWCLQEFDDEENKIGRDQIPWEWTQWFHAKSMRFVKKYEDSRFDFSLNKEEKKDCDIDLETTETILVDLDAGCFNPANSTIDEWCAYSFFGTSRRVNKFILDITQTDEEDEIGEICHVSGFVSYESEVDFLTHTTDDILIIKVRLDSEKFSSLKDIILKNKVDWMNLNLNGVSGFYSDWRPETSTNLIKILPRSFNQIKIQNTEALDEKFIPKLYQTAGFTLSYGVNSNLMKGLDAYESSTDIVEEDQFHEELDYGQSDATGNKPEMSQLDQLRLAMSQQEELHSTTRAVIFLAAILIAVVQFLA